MATDLKSGKREVDIMHDSLNIYEFTLAVSNGVPLEFSKDNGNTYIDLLQYKLSATDVISLINENAIVRYKLDDEQCFIYDGIKFPKPTKESPIKNSTYYIPSISNPNEYGYDECIYIGSDDDLWLFNNNLIHYSVENAISHSKALIEIAKRKEIGKDSLSSLMFTKKGYYYFVPTFKYKDGNYSSLTWNGNSDDYWYHKNGLVFNDKEQAVQFVKELVKLNNEICKTN